VRSFTCPRSLHKNLNKSQRKKNDESSPSVMAAKVPGSWGWAIEALRPKAGASRKGNIFVKVSLPADRKGHVPATRSGSVAHPLNAEGLSATVNPYEDRGVRSDHVRFIKKHRRSEARGRNRPPPGSCRTLPVTEGLLHSCVSS
jgi:hypothetical protein